MLCMKPRGNRLGPIISLRIIFLCGSNVNVSEWGRTWWFRPVNLKITIWAGSIWRGIYTVATLWRCIIFQLTWVFVFSSAKIRFLQITIESLLLSASNALFRCAITYAIFSFTHRMSIKYICGTWIVSRTLIYTSSLVLILGSIVLWKTNSVIAFRARVNVLSKTMSPRFWELSV